MPNSTPPPDVDIEEKPTHTWHQRKRLTNAEWVEQEIQHQVQDLNETNHAD